MPQSARLSEGGGGCNRYLGNAQIDPAFFYLGLPLDEGFPCEGFLLSSSGEACVRVSLREGSHVSNFWGNGN